MTNFTYVTLVLTIIGVLLMLMPQKWYAKGKVNWLTAGVWLAAFSAGILTMVWVIYILYDLAQSLFLHIINFMR